jgi:diadenosine tetraphosphate (Ap4A) HIT family hydrolase
MDRLYAPWRTKYVTTDEIKIEGCVFCHAVDTLDDDENLGVLYREKDFFIVMNKYPYSPGHIMIIPNLHTSNLEDLDSEIFKKISVSTQKAVKMLKEVLNAQGVNIGMNLGKAAGAGIAEHIHLHLVPRWKGDTNFITTIGGTRVYSSDIHEMYKKLKNVASDYFR